MVRSLVGSDSSIAAEIHTKTSERGVFSYGNDMIHYDVIRKSVSDNVKARKVVIKVHPDQRVVATVPHDATGETIHEAMLKRARWIWQNIEEFSKQKDYVLPKRYVSGETQFYLGRRYVLKVLTEQSDASQVKLNRGKLTVSLHPSTKVQKDTVKYLLDGWYTFRAKYIFKDRLNYALTKASWVEGIPSFRVMAMKTQWGSCSAKGNLMLNPHLVKAPKECIDYVILHELCHIAEHNHSERFWKLLTQVMPNWKEVKAKLDDMAEMYLNE